MPSPLAEDKHRNLRGCDLSGVFMPCVLIVFLLLMQTLSIITFSSDWKLQALSNKNTAKEWNVYSLHPHYKAFRNQAIRPNTAAVNCAIAAPLWCLDTLSKCWILNDDHIIGERGYYSFSTLFAPLSTRSQWHLLSQILHSQDVKQETTVWCRSKPNGRSWESWLRYRYCCLPERQTMKPLWGCVEFMMPCFPPRVRLKYAPMYFSYGGLLQDRLFPQS